MKMIALTALAAVTLAGAAAAAPNPSFALKGFGVNASGLSASTISRLNSAAHGSGTESEKAQKIRSILLQAGR